MNAPPAADAALSHLLSWLEKGGAQASKMHIVSMEGGERGVFATEDIAPGEMLIRIPSRYLLTLTDARASDIGRLLEAHTKLKDPNLYIASFLLQERERGADSFWKPFVDVLPPSYPTHPSSFQERELSLLKGSFLLEMIPAQRKTLEEAYAHLCQHVPGYSRFTLELFIWAHLTVLSRVFGAKLDETKVYGLAPLADMINDSVLWNAKWGWSSDGQFFELSAARPIPQGKELRTSYGSNSNFHLLRNYGFVHEHNPNNEVLVPLELSEKDPLMDEKRRLLGISDPSARHSFSLPLKPDARRLIELFSELRILHAQAEELEMLKAAPDPLTRAKEPLSPSNEAQVLRALSGACAAQLARYETSVEEDTRLLQDKNLSWNERNCILLRQGEKQILQVFAHVAD